MNTIHRDDAPAAVSPTASHDAPRPRRPWSRYVAVAGIAALLAGGTGYAAATSAASESASAAAVAPGASPTASPTATDWTQIAKKASPSVVAISVASGSGEGEGSGVVWDAAGDIVTNNHVVAGAGSGAKITVRIGAQTTYDARVVGTDPTTDLAVIRLVDPPNDLRPLPRASADSLQVGAPVMALGNPLGLSGTVTTGIVSALDRPVTTQAVSQDSGGMDNASTGGGQEQVVTAAIQTSAAINPGNSGGALVDASGRLVGINSSIASLSQGGGSGEAGNIGIGFAIPVGQVDTIVSQLAAGGTAKHASLGVSVTDAEVARDGATTSGAGVREVVPGSPAAQAGLATGQLVTAVDGQPVDSADGLVGQIRALAVGTKVTLTVADSSGKTHDVAVTLGDGEG